MSKPNELLPVECDETRRTIAEDMDWINNIELIDEGKLGYEDQQAALNMAFTAISNAFDKRPAGCRMKNDVLEGRYECTGCKFEAEYP